jgi:hypothetical protein
MLLPCEFKIKLAFEMVDWLTSKKNCGKTHAVRHILQRS